VPVGVLCCVREGGGTRCRVWWPSLPRDLFVGSGSQEGSREEGHPHAGPQDITRKQRTHALFCHNPQGSQVSRPPSRAPHRLPVLRSTMLRLQVPSLKALEEKYAKGNYLHGTICEVPEGKFVLTLYPCGVGRIRDEVRAASALHEHPVLGKCFDHMGLSFKAPLEAQGCLAVEKTG
jgi:hypothetical protein